jgi:PAS domain S-box-containing protein
MRLRAGRPTVDAGLTREDIEDILQLEDALFLLETLMDNVPDAIYFKDLESRFTRVNRYAAARFGVASPSLAVGRTDFDFFTSEHAQQALSDEQEIIRTGEPLVNVEEKETLPDGNFRWVSTTKLPGHQRPQEGRGAAPAPGVLRSAHRSAQPGAVPRQAAAPVSAGPALAGQSTVRGALSRSRSLQDHQ